MITMNGRTAVLILAAAQTAPAGSGNGPGQPQPGAARCRIPSCQASVDRSRLMCRPHWYQVPKPLRDAIWATWHSGAGIFSLAYQQAVAQAVATVQAATPTEGSPP